MQYCQVVNTIPAHDDAVSCMSYLDQMGFLVTGSWDCSVKLWKGFAKSHARSFRLGDSILAHLSCDDKITCLDSRRLTDCGKINVVIGTAAGAVFIWSIEQIHLPMEEGTEQSAPNVVRVTQGKRFGAIKGLLFNKDGSKIACCDAKGRLVVYFVHDVAKIEQSCDNVVVLLERELGTELSCMNWSLGESQLVVGDVRGVFYVWNMAVGRMDQEMQLHSGGISAICGLDGRRFITAGEEATQKHCIKVWNCDLS